ncbi:MULTISPECIES: hypothetical protein [unclassified Ruegeria]|uniref:hypothetical protein n=1 Tax=unclassified Ruegeria TaxID=2625375 RepID=UPI00148876F6|nr:MULTISPECIES: hypothetical protein [unclassified Ruegeria]
MKIGRGPLALTPRIAKAAAGAVKARPALVYPSWCASAACDAPLERATCAPTPAIGAAHRNTVAVETASLPAGTAARTAFELTTGALIVPLIDAAPVWKGVPVIQTASVLKLRETGVAEGDQQQCNGKES